MEDNLKKLICLKVKNLRKKYDLTQEEFCEKVDIDMTTISKIENLKVCPSLQTFCKIMKAFKLEPNDFLDFIKYNKSEQDILNSLIIEQLALAPEDLKKKVLELLELVNK